MRERTPAPVLILCACKCNGKDSHTSGFISLAPGMSELLFELYGVDSVAYGVDALFSFGYGSHANKLDGMFVCG